MLLTCTNDLSLTCRSVPLISEPQVSRISLSYEVSDLIPPVSLTYCGCLLAVATNLHTEMKHPLSAGVTWGMTWGMISSMSWGMTWGCANVCQHAVDDRSCPDQGPGMPSGS
jgi:hypothetical protein